MEELDKAGVPDNKKYASNNMFMGNVTICRYTKKPNSQFVKFVENNKEIEIGTTTISEVSLVTTNLVCHPSKTKIVNKYILDK